MATYMGALNDRWVSTEHCFVYFIGCCHALSPNSACQLHCTLQCTGERLVGGWSGPLRIDAGMGRSSLQSTDISTTFLTTLPCICTTCPDFIQRGESLCKSSQLDYCVWIMIHNNTHVTIFVYFLYPLSKWILCNFDYPFEEAIWKILPLWPHLTPRRHHDQHQISFPNHGHLCHHLWIEVSCGKAN